MANETLLVIAAAGVPPYSARGLTQTLVPLGGAMRRTINGTLTDVSASQFRKYSSVITCTDQQPPAMSGVWPGQTLTVDCVAELSYLTATGSPERTVVATRTEGLFTFYRPRLTMKVADWNTRTDEYGARIGWELTLEEV